MALPIQTTSKKGRITSLISASVLVTGLLLMAFVSGASGSSAAARSDSGVHAPH
jgi:uncharacterized membrane protein